MSRTSRFAFATLAALSAGGMVFLGCDREDRDEAVQTVDKAVEKGADVAKEAGSELKEAGGEIKEAVTDGGTGGRDPEGEQTDEAVHTVLAGVVEGAVHKDDGLVQVVERFAEADRQRLGVDNPEGLNNGQVLDGRIEQFRKDWDAQYKGDFDIDNPAKVFQPNVFTISDAAGADSTVVTVKGKNHGLPDLQVPMVREEGGWKIDVPDSLSADKLRENVLAHLTAANEAKAKWPANAPEGYAVVTHHVLMAIFDKPVRQ